LIKEIILLSYQAKEKLLPTKKLVKIDDLQKPSSYYFNIF
jgi:hypothetical protein